MKKRSLSKKEKAGGQAMAKQKNPITVGTPMSSITILSFMKKWENQRREKMAKPKKGGSKDMRLKANRRRKGSAKGRKPRKQKNLKE